MKKITALLSLLSLATITTATNYTDYVDPRIGTGDHGHVFVGANVPQGMVNAGPTQLNVGWDWCSGYHLTGDTIVGFAQLHLSGTGCSDLGDVALMPVNGDVEHTRAGLGSHFTHESETLRAGYYKVKLDRFDIDCEVTATTRTALYRFGYSQPNDRRLIVDLANGVGDRLTQCRMEQIDDHTWVGYRLSKGWTAHQEIYFELTTSQPATSYTWDGKYAELLFDDASSAEPLLAKVALSPTSELNAHLNRVAELDGWDFEAVRLAADQRWNQELSRIEATFATEREMRIFYTGMYHMMVAPQVWNDVNGDYMGSDYHIYREGDFQNYTTWSLWDTYRSLHPLATLVMQDKLTDYAQTFLHIFDEEGELPVWHLMSNDTYCMVGCPAVPVLADMILKNVPGIDPEHAAKAIKSSLTKTYAKRSLEWMEKIGYVPYNHGDYQCIGKSMEYFLADWAGAQALGRLGYAEDSAHFANRSMGYKKLFDPDLLYIRAKDDQGVFRSAEGFNPCYQTNDYTEGNPWHYSFLVPHDVNGLIECFGGTEMFLSRLDSLFLADSQLNDDANPDISGLIGQYAHGNEPSHHVIYLYNYAGRPDKAAERLRQVMTELYDDQPAGLCGNEDVGQMSSWYILSAIGLYQVEPCGGKWQIGSPIINEAKLHVGGDKTFTVRTHDNSPTNIYVQRVLLNGKPVTQTWIDHQDIVNGGNLDIYLGAAPSAWGK